MVNKNANNLWQLCGCATTGIVCTSGTFFSSGIVFWVLIVVAGLSFLSILLLRSDWVEEEEVSGAGKKTKAFFKGTIAFVWLLLSLFLVPVITVATLVEVLLEKNERRKEIRMTRMKIALFGAFFFLFLLLFVASAVAITTNDKLLGVLLCAVSAGIATPGLFIVVFEFGGLDRDDEKPNSMREAVQIFLFGFLSPVKFYLQIFPAVFLSFIKDKRKKET